MQVDEAAEGAEPGVATRAPGTDGFDDVFGSAIARAVRRAVDGVGREPVGSSSDPAGPEAPPLPVEAPDGPAEAGPPLLPPPGVSDPYQLLGVGRRAPWSEITAAYKRRARAWHPDGAPDAEQDRRHELIRDLNAAYAELRVRRGR